MISVGRSASTEQPPTVRDVVEVAKLIDVSKCIGCKACQAACMEWNDLRQPIQVNHGNYTNPEDLSPAVWTLMRFTEYEDPDGNLEWLIRKDGCMHCSDPGCLKACPSPGAIVQYENGIVDFISENCIGCTYCIKGCPFNIPRISKVDHKVYKCSLCVDRVSVGQAPALRQELPNRSHHLRHQSRHDYARQKQDRRPELPWLPRTPVCNDPPGVGGTHVMYVLHHADKPSLYANLPDHPKISPIVQLWKGGFKAVGLAGLALAAVGSFFHYVAAGPDEVAKADETDAFGLAHGEEPPKRDH